ncbi:MAG TPA: thioredoxin family protein [Bryobacteraceae bacterium]|nr:thioredoxin family protein [Bryobacteraceae bacterium]
MPQATSVITSTRFEQGLTYAGFLAQATVNRDKFEQYYNDSALTGDDLAFFKKAAALPNGPKKAMAIAEAWCGDVYRELPTLARIAEASGIELRIFLRDENPDIMDEFLSNNGKSRAIPVFVFYNTDLQYITHFTERSANAHAELAAISDQIKVEQNLPPGATFATLPEAQRQVFLRSLIAQIVPRFPRWRKESIQEMRQLLAKALNLPNAG